MRFFLSFLVILHISCVAERPRIEATTQNANDFNSNSVASPRQDKTEPKANNKAQASTIRSIDFRNFTYDWWPESYEKPPNNGKVNLREGEMHVELGKQSEDSHNKIHFSLQNIFYGDVAGDASEEAIVTLYVDSWKDGRSRYTFVYTLANGVPKMLWYYETGYMSFDGLRDVYVESGQLVIEQYAPWRDDKGTPIGKAAKTYYRSYFKWDGKRFQMAKVEKDLPNEFGTEPKIIIGLRTNP